MKKSIKADIGILEIKKQASKGLLKCSNCEIEFKIKPIKKDFLMELLISGYVTVNSQEGKVTTICRTCQGLRALND